jgi:hypothetical protein
MIKKINDFYVIKVNGVTIYYSFNYIVAFDSFSTGLVIHENTSGQKTGRHLLLIDPNKEIIRTEEQEFLKIRKEVFAMHQIDISFSVWGGKIW